MAEHHIARSCAADRRTNDQVIVAVAIDISCPTDREAKRFVS